MAFEYAFFDQVADTFSGEGTDAGRKRREAKWNTMQRRSPAASNMASRAATSVIDRMPAGSLAPAADPLIAKGINTQNRWAYDAWIREGYSEDDAIAAALGRPRATQPAAPSATAAMNPTAAAPAAAPDPYDRWLNDPQIKEARNRLSGLYAAEESRVNPYSTDSPAFQAMVKGQQDQARLNFAPGAQRMFNSLAGGGATSGGVAASRAAYSGGAARALADIATSAATKQYENQQAYEDRRRQAMANLASGAASVGLGVTGQGIGVTSTQQALKEDTRRFDEGLATRKDEFAKTYAQVDQGRKDQLALAYSQLSQQAKQFADQLDFTKSTTLSAEDQYNLGIIQTVTGAVGVVGGSAVSAMKR